MEVKLAWLEPASDGEGAAAQDAEPQAPESSPRSSRRKPPRLPGAKVTLPPMPLVPPDGPPRHRTMEVEMSWLEVVDEKEGGTERES